MIKVTAFEPTYFRPPAFAGLEEVVVFPDGETKRENIPNGSVWVFNARQHRFVPDIHGADIGCGMTAFKIPEVDHRQAANLIYQRLAGTGIIGRGNHFVDICSGIQAVYSGEESDYRVLLIHTHGKDTSVPENLQQALAKQAAAARSRMELGEELMELLEVEGKLLGEWPHNTIEEKGDKILYRKGTVKVEPDKSHVLPAHLAAHILVYTIKAENRPPYDSFPHATGRRGKRGETKVTAEQAAGLRKFVYIPEGIADSSLRTEHSSCYNGYDRIFRAMRKQDFFLPVGQMEILSYVGKI